MTHCHGKDLELWKKSRIFRVVVGGSVSAHPKKMKKKCKKACICEIFFVY